MNVPTISVVIPAYNRAACLGEALESVLAQTRLPDEIIVADDASTDATRELLQTYGNRVRVVRLERHAGHPSVVRNAALREASGTFVALLDSDDRWMPAKLEKQVGFMLRHPEFELSHTYCLKVDGTGRSLGVRHEGQLPPSGDYLRPLIGHCIVTTSTVMLRKDLLNRMGMFNERPAYRTGEDYEFFLRAARHTAIGLVDEVLACYREASSGISQEDFNWRAKPRYVEMQRELLRRREWWRGRIKKREIVAALVSNCLENNGYWLGCRRFGRAAYFAALALRFAPANAGAWKALAKSAVAPLGVTGEKT